LGNIFHILFADLVWRQNLSF